MPIDLHLPRKPGLFITGTACGAGKTLIAGSLAKLLTGDGLKVGIFKPVATGCKRKWEGLAKNETEFLAYCAGSDLPLSSITPIGYLTDAEPVVCAAKERKPLDFDRIAAAYGQVCRTSDVIIVEGLGGVRTPLTEQFDLLDLAVEFALPTVIVTLPHRDAVAHTLMTIDSLRAAGLTVAGVIINGCDARTETPSSITAPQLIAHFGDTEILAEVPFDETADLTGQNPGELIQPALAGCNWRKLMAL